MALVSDLTKAATVQLSHEKPKYDQTYSATYDDSLLSGLPAKYIQQSAPFVTATGAAYAPADHRDVFYNVWILAHHHLLAKAQATLLSIIRARLPDTPFLPLHPLYQGTELLQKYWLYATNRLHKDSTDNLANQVRLFTTPLVDYADFSGVLQPVRPISVAKNILAHNRDTPVQSYSSSQSLQTGTHCPVDIRAEFGQTIQDYLAVFGDQGVQVPLLHGNSHGGQRRRARLGPGLSRPGRDDFS